MNHFSYYLSLQMSYYTYIIEGKKRGRYYCGSTNNLGRRVRQHNNPNYKGSLTTKRFDGPWGLIWSKILTTRSEAMSLEKKIKKRGIGRYLDSVVQLEKFRHRRN